uniref:Uncharacterized protein n=1 Tax=Anguilla anguilla TaxID=7936 RepID=A0A0E9Q5C1_ANGAN
MMTQSKQRPTLTELPYSRTNPPMNSCRFTIRYVTPESWTTGGSLSRLRRGTTSCPTSPLCMRASGWRP